VYAKHQHQQQQVRWAPVGCCSSVTEAVAAAAAAAAEGTADAESTEIDDISVNSQMRQYGQADVQQLQKQCRKQRTTWAVMSGGLLHVSSSNSAVSTVKLDFHSTDLSCNGNIRWAVAQLIPVDLQRWDCATPGNREWQPPRQQGIGVASARFRCYAQQWIQQLVKG
jgi:hypothetical protein